jgi:hypothetical protein
MKPIGKTKAISSDETLHRPTGLGWEQLAAALNHARDVGPTK